MRVLIAAAAAVIFALSAGFSAEAANKPCRDAKGRFTKCEAAKAAVQCRDIKTKKFAKCSAPNTEPVPSTNHM